MADVYQNGILYNVGKAIKNGAEYPFDWTMLNEYNQLVTYYDTAQQQIRTSIINKGVNVPANATIDEYPGYIDQIETGGIYGNLDSSPIRVNLFKESSSDNVGNISGKPLSYIYGDYLFIIAPYGTYNGSYQQANVRCGAWKKGTEDYKASKATVSSSSDKGFDMVGAKINISDTTASIEICLRKFITNESFYFYKLTNSFNMSSLTWGSWTTVSEGPTATNPYFSEYVNDQDLVSGDVEQIDGAGIIRLIPGGSQTGKNLSLYTTSVYAGTSQGESANIYRASMSGKYAFTATYNGYGTPSHGHSVEVSASGGTSFRDVKYTSTAKTVTGDFYAPSGSYIVVTATGYSYSSCAVENIKLQYMGFEDR